jgi:hypothetical protein
MALAYRDVSMTSTMPELPGMRVTQVSDPQIMAALQRRRIEDMRGRFEQGHRAYVSYVNDDAAAFGWVATREAVIGELGLQVRIPRRQRYLWNFVTLPAQRGKGVYPRLLNAIVTTESIDADKLWIAYAPENHASAAGIHKAGFVTVGSLAFDELGQPRQCWRCMRNGAAQCRPGGCCCDYQRPQQSCEN